MASIAFSCRRGIGVNYLDDRAIIGDGIAFRVSSILEQPLKMIPLDYQGADGKRHRFTASQPDR